MVNAISKEPKEREPQFPAFKFIELIKRRWEVCGTMREFNMPRISPEARKLVRSLEHEKKFGGAVISLDFLLTKKTAMNFLSAIGNFCRRGKLVITRIHTDNLLYWKGEKIDNASQRYVLIEWREIPKKSTGRR